MAVKEGIDEKVTGLKEMRMSQVVFRGEERKEQSG